MVSLSELRDVPPWLPEHFIGGHPALDFINTVSHRADPELAIDRFDSINKIACWCEHTQLLDADTVCQIQVDPVFRDQEGTLVRRLADLRAHAGRILDSVATTGEVPSTGFAYVLASAGAAVASLEIETQGNRLHMRNAGKPMKPDQIVSILALQVLDALYHLPRNRLRACPGCRWLFFDASRGGRRKWCSMQDCGNRAKARRHYARHKGRNNSLLDW